MRIALCQINPTVGALQSNANKIIGIIQTYSPRCDLIIFPELVLTGYPPQDLLADFQFILHTEAALNKIAATTVLPKYNSYSATSSYINFISES